MEYWIGKNLREDATRAQRAIEGVDGSTRGLIQYFAPAMDIAVSETETPAIFQMLDYAQKQLRASAKSLKNSGFRKRPFVHLGEPTLIPEEEEEEAMESSYPSSHSVRGWGFALLLTELAPDSTDIILTAGYEYGYNRVIAGYHYASDVQAARLVAAYTVARLHNDPTFMTLLGAARIEHTQKKNQDEGVATVTAQPQSEKIGWYTLSGQRIGDNTPVPIGVYIRNGKTVLIK